MEKDFNSFTAVFRNSNVHLSSSCSANINAITGTESAEEMMESRILYGYEEGDRAPDLSPSSVRINTKDGKEKEMYSVRFAGDRPKDYVPKLVGKAYKLMEEWPDGSLHALFAGTDKPYDVGKWNWAEGFTPEESAGVRSMNLAPRYGWHMGTGVPSTHHLMGVGDLMNPKMGYYSKTGIGHPKGSRRVWAEVEFDATMDFTPVAEKNPSHEKDIRGLCPFGGYYMFQESNLSNWIVASGIRFSRIIEEEERQKILNEAGYDEELFWRRLKLRPTLKMGITNLSHKLSSGSGNKTDIIEKIERLLELESENETVLRSRGEEALSDEDIKLIKKEFDGICEQIDNKKTLPDELSGFLQKRKELFPTASRKRLTETESRKERERIRRGIFLNSEWRHDASPVLTKEGYPIGIRYFGKDGNDFLSIGDVSTLSEFPLSSLTPLFDELLRKDCPQLYEEGQRIIKETSVYMDIMKDSMRSDLNRRKHPPFVEAHMLLSCEQGDSLLVLLGNANLKKDYLGWEKRYWEMIRMRFQKHEKSKLPNSWRKFASSKVADYFNKRNDLNR